MTNKSTLFYKEEAVLKRATDFLDKVKEKEQDSPLMEEYRCILKDYKKLFKQTEFLVKMSDKQQEQLRTLSQKLEASNLLIRKIFGRYLSDEVVYTLLETDEGLSLGGERREITILSSDIRGFTARSNDLSPEKVIDFINFYLSEMTEVVGQYQGTINEIMGDGVLVFFGAPIKREDDPERAVACAIAMQLAVNKINEKILGAGSLPIEMGIGINTGEVIVGNIGSEKRMKYSAMGNDVNLAYRIEAYTTGGQIFISESTLEKVSSIVDISSEMKIKPKGVKSPIKIYEVEGIGGKYNVHMRKEKEIFVPLKEKIPVKYAILEGKKANEQEFSGYLYELSSSTKGALLYCDVEKDEFPSAMSDLRISLIQLPSYYIPNRMGEFHQPKILIVDDVPNNIDILRKFLASEGYRLSFANDGEKALKIAPRALPDLILLDVMMPGITGFEVCRTLKSMPETREIPVIFMTALNSTEDKVEGFESGGVDFITKPVQEQEVLMRVRNHIHTYTLQKKLKAKNAQLAQEIAEWEQADEFFRKTDDIYAKVLKRSIEKSNVYVYFTSIPVNIKAQLIANMKRTDFFESKVTY
jgi:class 3 adenylate cyclase/DNA-binding response OmpR family regulator